jgi:putative solute:sodium symporter small subunit
MVESGNEPASTPPAAIDPATARAYWSRTSGLMWTVLVLWFLAGFGIHLFAVQLNAIHVVGFPLAYYFAAQGSLIVFVVGLFWFARRQNQIDEEFGVQED